MRTEGIILIGVSAFFAVITAIYWFTSYELSGAVLLLFTTGLGAIPGVWLLWEARKSPRRPEDDENADQADGAGPVGAFPETSVWPLVFSLGLALSGVGFVFGLWFALLGAPLALAALFGGILEGRRGPAASRGPERPLQSGSRGPERPDAGGP